MEKPDYWLFLEPYVYLSILENEVLLFNTLDGNILRFQEPLIVMLMKELEDVNNMGVVPVRYKGNALIRSLVSDLRNTFMGDIVSIDTSIRKPIQLRPHLRIDAQKFKEYSVDTFPLREVTFFANSVCNQTCPYCDSYIDQFDCCCKYEIGSGKTLCIRNIFDILYPFFETLYRINIVLYNIDDRQVLDYMNGLPVSVKKKCRLIINYKNINSRHINELKELEPLLEILLIDFSDLDMECLPLEYISAFKWIVQSNRDVEFLIQHNLMDSSDTVLFYNGSNLDFVKEQVSYTLDDLRANPTSMRRIHQNISINSIFFGKILIYKDGMVRLNAKTPVVGNLFEKSLPAIIKRVIEDQENVWFFTRDKKKVCSNCVFRYICPPISELELQLDNTTYCLSIK